MTGNPKLAPGKKWAPFGSIGLALIVWLVGALALSGQATRRNTPFGRPHR